MPPPKELPLREEPELLDLPKPPERLEPEEPKLELDELDDGRDAEDVGRELEEDEGLLAEDELWPELVPAELEEEPGGREVELEEEPNDRCETVGLVRARALAAVFSALGETTDLERTEREESVQVDPAVRPVMERV